MQTIAGWWVGALLGACLLMGVPPSAASSVARRGEPKPANRPWPYGTAVPVARARRDRVATLSDQRGEDGRSKDSSSSGTVVYNPSPSGPAFSGDREKEVDDGGGSEKSGVKSAGEDTEEKNNDLSRKGENGKADGDEENSESDNETNDKNEIGSKHEVPSFFKITSHVTSSTSVSGSSKLKSKLGKSEPDANEAEQSSKKLIERSRTTSTKSVKKNVNESSGKQANVSLKQAAYAHFFSAARRSSSNSENSSDDQRSENEVKNEKTEVEEEGDQKSTVGTERNSFFTIASHKAKSTSTRQPERSSNKQGEQKTSDRDEENKKEQEDDKEGNDNEKKDNGDEESKGDSTGDEGEDEEDEQEEEEEEEEEEDEEEGSEEEESEEDESSEEDDGSPAFIVLRRPNANSDRNDRNLESAKHFSLGQVGYRIQKDISGEKLLFLPVIDGKDLSISTIRTLSSQLSKRGEPIHLEYKELKDGVEGYVAELDNSGTEYFINKLMELISNLDKSDEITSHSFANGENANENSNGNISKNVYTKLRSSQNLENTSKSLPTHFQPPQNRFKTQISLSRKETAQKTPTVPSRDGSRNASPVLERAQSGKSSTGSQREKPLRTSTIPFFRSQSSGRSSSTGTKINTTPEPSHRGSLTNEDSALHDGQLSDESPRSKGALLPTTIPIEISPARSSSKSLDEQPRIRIKAELVHSANPNSKTTASIKISDEEIRAITNRYSQFLENYRRSRARARTPDSQILREDQARKQLSEIGNSLISSKDSTRSNVPELSPSRQIAPVEIVTAVPVPIDEERGPVPQSRKKTIGQTGETIFVAPDKEQSDNIANGDENLDRTLPASAVKTLHSSSTLEIQSDTEERRRENWNYLNQNAKVNIETSDREPSLELIASGLPVPSNAARQESKAVSLVPLTEPDSVKADKVVLISGVESDSLERDTSDAVAIPSTRIKLISNEVSLTPQPSLISGAALKHGPANNRIDYVREVIRNRLLTIFNTRAQKEAAGQANVRFELEDVDPSQLPLPVLSKLQASRLSNDGIRLADLSSSTAIILETGSRSESERELPTLKPDGSSNFLPVEAQRRDFITSTGGDSAFVLNSGAGPVVKQYVKKPSSSGNIVEETQQGENSRNGYVSGIPVINVSSDTKVIDHTSAAGGTGAQLSTSAQDVDISGIQSVIKTELTGEIEAPVPLIFAADSANQPASVPRGESSVVDILDNKVPATHEPGVLLDGVKLEAPQPVLEIENETQVSVKHDVTSDGTFTNSNIPQQELILSDIGQLDSGAADLIANPITEQERVDSSFNDVVTPQQQDSSLASLPSGLDGASGVKAEQLFSAVGNTAGPTAQPNLFDRGPSNGDVIIPAEEILIPEQSDDVLAEVDLSLPTIDQGLDGLAESPTIQAIPVTSNLGESSLQEFSDLALGPALDHSESLLPTSLTSTDGDTAQLQEIGAQIENLSSSPSSSFASELSAPVQMENLSSVGDNVVTGFNSEQTVSGKSFTQAVEQKQKSVDQVDIKNAESQTSADLRETIQERFNARLMQMIKERAQGITLGSINPVTQQTETAESARDGIVQVQEIEDRPPQLSTSTDSSVLKPSRTLGATSDATDDALSEKNFENKALPAAKTFVDLKPSKTPETTIDDEIQKRFQARLMQMLQERANAMLKVAANPIGAVEKQAAVSLTETESTSRAVELNASTVLPAPVIENTDSLLVTPKTVSVSQKELKIIEGLGSTDARSTHEIANQPEDQQATITTNIAIQDQLQERLNARLTQIIQDRTKASDASLLNSRNSEKESINVAPPEIITITSDIETEADTVDSQRSDILTTEATITKEKFVDEISDAAIHEFMLERFNAGITTVVHTDGDGVQPTSEATVNIFSTPAVQKSGATVQKINLEAAWSDNDGDRFTLTPQIELKDNVRINTTREIEINDLMNSRLMELLRQGMEDHISVAVAKELGSDTATSVAEPSNLELKGKSSDPQNLQTIEQLIAGVEGAPGAATANGGGAHQTGQESTGIAPVGAGVEALKFESLPNVRTLSPGEITSLNNIGGSAQITGAISSSIGNEVQLSAAAPAVAPESILQGFVEGVSLKPLKAVRLPNSIPHEQVPTSPVKIHPQLSVQRVEISSTPQVAPSVTRQQSFPVASQTRGSHVLTQEQFLSHFRAIENQQRLGPVRSSQSFLRTSSQPGALNVLQTFGIGGNVVKANRQPGRIQNEVFIQPVARRRRPQLLPAPPNPPFIPAFPNARSARLLSRVNEDDLRRSSSKTNQLARFTPAVPSRLSFVGSSIGNPFIVLSEGKSLQKSLSNSEDPSVVRSASGGVEIRKAEIPSLIARPKRVEVSSQLSPSAEQVAADQHPVVVKARLQKVLTEIDLSNSGNSNSLRNIARTDGIVLNSTPPRATTVKVPLALAKSMPSGLVNLKPSRTTAIKIPLAMAKSIPNDVEQRLLTASKQSRLTTKSSAATNLRFAKQGSSKMSAQSSSAFFNQQPLKLSSTQGLRVVHQQEFQRDTKVNGQRNSEARSASRKATANQALGIHQSNSAAVLDNGLEIVTVRSRSGNLFTIPTRLFQEFLDRKGSESRKINLHQARTLLQTLFVDGERQRLKRKAPQVGTVTRDQLQHVMDYIRLHRTTSEISARNKRAADFNEDTQGEEESVATLPKKLFDLKNTQHSEETLSPKIVFDDRGAYLTNGKGKNIFFQALEVFYH